MAGRKLALVLLLVAFLLSGSLVLGTQPRPPNVVLILADDLGWSDLQCYGSRFYETPHMSEITIAEAFKAHGYRTAHIGKWHLSEEPYGPLQQGFDIQIPRWNKGWPKTGYHAPFQLDGLEGQAGDYLTDRLTDEAERFIELHQDKPFFLYMSHFAVHDPIEGRADLVAKYKSKLSNMQRSSDADFILEGNPDDPRPLSRDELQSRLTKPAWRGFKVFSDRIVKIKQQQDNVQFAAMVESLDQSVGRLIAKLQSLKLDHNTIVLVTSDNGGMSAANFGRPDRVVNKDRLDAAYATSNLPLRGAKGWLYEGGIKVPLIVYSELRCSKSPRTRLALGGSKDDVLEVDGGRAGWQIESQNCGLFLDRQLDRHGLPFRFAGYLVGHR